MNFRESGIRSSYFDNILRLHVNDQRLRLISRLSTVAFTLLISSAPVLAAGDVTSVPNGQALVFSRYPDFTQGYGTHFPQGFQAAQHLYSSSGTWKQYINMRNIYGYYNVPQSEREALISYANGDRATSTPDVNGKVLHDLPYNGAVASGQSFHEHNGVGANGQTFGQAFTQFWYDDNWLARYMADAYGAPQPSGLTQPPSSYRWQALSRDASNYVAPPGYELDKMALLGMAYLDRNDVGAALYCWRDILNRSGQYFNQSERRYMYPSIGDEYHRGLFKILTDKLVNASVSDSDRNLLIQHSISLKSDIISSQQFDSQGPIGWRTSRSESNSLINTETTSIHALALGASAKYSFEPGRWPLSTPTGFYLRSYNVLSAVKGLSPSGTMSFGPYFNLPTGSYTADFYVRSSDSAGTIASLDVHDSNVGATLAVAYLTDNNLPANDQWARFSLPVSVGNQSNSLEFRIYWTGSSNLDVAAIRLR